MNTIEVAFLNGFQAFKDGRAAVSPYAIFTTLTRAWYQGYTKAQKARARGAL